MNERSKDRPRRYRHIFLDAEGTLYVPKNGRSRWYFWARPTPEDAVEFFELDRGVIQALERLRSDADTLCLVSLNTEPVLNAVLDHFGLRRFFDAIMVNGDKGKRISRFLNERGLNKEDSLMVGDTPSLDLYPVQKAGINAILVDRDYNRNVRAERIKGIFELPAWLRLADIVEDIANEKARIATLDEYNGAMARSPADTKRLIARTEA
jgi:phosphoglycolate phosphatase-like HAD superfamily hydrolase